MSNYARYKEWWIRTQSQDYSPSLYTSSIVGNGFVRHINSMTPYEILEMLEDWKEVVDKEDEDKETLKELGRIEFVEETIAEDGTANMTFEVDDAASKLIEEIGLRFLVTCAAYDLDLEDAFNAVSDRGEYLQQKPNDNEESSSLGE